MEAHRRLIWPSADRPVKSISIANADDAMVRTPDLHQLPSHHIERLLRREPPDPLPIAGKIALYNLSPGLVRQSMVDQAYRFFRGPPRRPSNSGDSKSQCGPASLTNSFG